MFRFLCAGKGVTAKFAVRNIEESVELRLKRRAARHGTGIEAEVRLVFRNAVKDDEPRDIAGLGSRIAAGFKSLGLVDPLPEFRGQAPGPTDPKA